MTHTKEERIELGRKSLDELRGMFKAWLKSDFKWAIGIVTTERTTGEDDECDFLWSEWTDKFTNWMSPYITRLRVTKYITDDDLRDFGEEMYDNMKIMLEAIYALTGDVNNEQDV